jgi:hypothetical protein
MHKIKGTILWKSSVGDLGEAGSTVALLIESAHKVTGAPEDEPLVIPFWSSMADLPLIGTSRAMPLLLIKLPLSCAGDLEGISTSPMQLKVVGDAHWARRVTCLELAGKRDTVQLRTEHILPVLRMVATGTVVIIVACGDSVIAVEHVFTRRELLEVCSALHQDYLVSDKYDDDTQGRNPYAEFLCKRTETRTTWLPMVAMFDRYEEFFYGVLRGGESEEE